MLSGKTFPGVSLKSPGLENAARVVLVFWATVVLVFAAFPAGSVGRTLAAAGASWAAETLAVVALSIAFIRSAGIERLFWAFFGGAVFFRYTSDLVWIDSWFFGLDLLPTYQAVAHAISYPLFFGVLFWLAKRSRREMTPVAVLDTASAMLSSGVLLWYFVLGPATAPANLDGWEASIALIQPTCDLGLFLLALGTLLTVRSPFAAYLTGSLLLLLVADGAYLLELRISGTYVVGGWPVLFWSGGVTLLGVAALYRGSTGLLARGEPRGSNLGRFLFWLGPLSPPLQYAALLIWATLRPPVPDYVLLCGAALLGIFAVRAWTITYVDGLLADKQATLAVKEEQGRISEEMHDTLKQNVHGIP